MFGMLHAGKREGVQNDDDTKRNEHAVIRLRKRAAYLQDSSTVWSFGYTADVSSEGNVACFRLEARENWYHGRLESLGTHSRRRGLRGLAGDEMERGADAQVYR
jgi:hypothetical protein